MDLITREKNNFFTLEMFSYNGDEFDNKAAINTRLSIILVEKGSGILVKNNESLSFTSPSLICLNEREHAIIHKSFNCDIRVIHFHPQIINYELNFENIREYHTDISLTAQQDAYLCKTFIERNSMFNGIFSLGPNTFNMFKGLFDNYYSEITNQDNNFWPCRSRSYLLELLFNINKLDNRLESNTISVNKKDPEIESIILYINNNYSNKITIPLLTKEFNINRTSLSKRFSEYTGDSIMTYINKLRINIASILLVDTRIPISEIVERCGYNDSTHFFRMFKKYKIISPKEYREKNCWVD